MNQPNRIEERFYFCTPPLAAIVQCQICWSKQAAISNQTCLHAQQPFHSTRVALVHLTTTAAIIAKHVATAYNIELVRRMLSN